MLIPIRVVPRKQTLSSLAKNAEMKAFFSASIPKALYSRNSNGNHYHKEGTFNENRIFYPGMS